MKKIEFLDTLFMGWFILAFLGLIIGFWKPLLIVAGLILVVFLLGLLAQFAYYAVKKLM